MRIDLKQLSLPQFVAYSPVKPPADLTSGKLTIDADVSYRISADRKPELTVKGLVRLDDISVNMKNGAAPCQAPFTGSQGIQTGSICPASTNSKQYHWMGWSCLSIATGKVSGCIPACCRRQRPARNRRIVDKKPESGKKEKELLLLVSSLACTNGTVHFSDELPKRRLQNDGFRDRLHGT